MDILGKLGVQNSEFIPSLNTGTLFDVATGGFAQSVYESMILNGGLSLINGMLGREQRFKTTLLLSLIVGAMARYPGSQTWVHDTEISIHTVYRILKLLGDSHWKNVSDEALRLTNITQYDMAGVYTEISKVVDHKLKYIKDYTVETPMINPMTKKPYKIIIPTFFIIDSWSKFKLNQMEEVLKEHKIGSDKSRTLYMNDGLAKSHFMQSLPVLAAKGGIYFFLSAHIGDKFELNPFSKSPKELQHMNANDSIKGAGSQFGYLTSPLLENRSADLLLSSDRKGAQYPYPGIKAIKELSVVKSIVDRCKTNLSGHNIPFVVSQNSGVLPNLTNYHYLVKNKKGREDVGFGLVGNNTRRSCMLFKDITFMRTTVRQQLEKSYEVSRGFELLAQLCYIQNNWLATKFDGIDLGISADDFISGINKLGDTAKEDILNSRGHWTYDKKEKRKYYSLFDVVKMIQNGRVAK